MSTKLSRREFVASSVAAGTALVVGFAFGVPAEAQPSTPKPSVCPFDAWIRIDAHGCVTLIVAKSELGQGVFTTLPMILAEELEADWQAVRIEQAVLNQAIYDHSTGGSTSVRTSYLPLRQAAAAARQMLVETAAERWGVGVSTCTASAGAVVGPGGRRLPYGDLVVAAARRPVPDLATVPLKDPSRFRLLGTSLPRVDIPAKLDGSAVFGLDVRVPGMLFAAIARCPVYGGRPRSFDATPVRSMPGVKAVVELPGIGRGAFTRAGVAVVAEDSWLAIRARDALRVDWDLGPNAGESSAAIARQLEELLSRGGTVVRDEGDAPSALAASARRIEARYAVPFQAHVPMEPMNATVHVRSGEVEAWLPSQGTPWMQAILGGVGGVPPEEVRVHTTFVGGAFGRRNHADFAVEATLVSRMVGAPVQVVWTREDDIHNDFCRPMSVHWLTAALDEQGRPGAWQHRIASTSVVAFWDEGRGKPETSEVGGAADMPYAIPAVRVEHAAARTNVPVMWWRSVEHAVNAFVVESFIDELAAAAGSDPLAFRLSLLAQPRRLRYLIDHAFELETDRLRRVLELAAERAGWGKALPTGRGRGIAAHASFHSYVAQVAEVSVEAGRVRVHRVTCAVDCGRVLHPDNTMAQVEGAIAFGLTATLKGEITLQDGRIVQGNFDDYDVLRIGEMPEVDVLLIDSQAPPTGIGEPGVPPVAPAVTNAIFRATGRRVRRLPVRVEDFQ